MKSTSLIPPDEAIASMLSLITPVTEIESVPLTAATGRITATPVRSSVDEPSFDNAAMDGYAVRLADISSGEPLQVAGILLAGDIWQDKWPAGCCIRIMTGAALPEGSEAVVMQEEAELTAGGVRFSAPVSAGQNIRRKGEDVGSGNTVLKTGVRLGATQLPLLASLGITQLQVYRALKVALFSTGDELQIPGMPLKAGQRYDTNRLAVTLMLRKLGCTVIDMGIIGDNPVALREAFIQADTEADVVISTGGVSVGEADYTKTILEELGEMTFWKLAMKPGKPFAFGRLENSWFCGLPGNPVSAIVTFYQLVVPLLTKLAGQSGSALPARQRVRTATPLKKSRGRVDFQRGILKRGDDGFLQVYSTGSQDSHRLSSFSQAGCFIVLERERGPVQAGEWVDVEPFSALLGG